MGYLLLICAIILELTGTTFLKYSDGFTKLIPSLACIFSYALCFFVFSKSLLCINLSIAYATWSGVGLIAATLISYYIFNEGISAWGVLGIVLIVAGVFILNLFGTIPTK